jgi:hypothetical protein
VPSARLIFVEPDVYRADEPDTGHVDSGHHEPDKEVSP